LRTGICKEDEFLEESEVALMALKHRITINVTDSNGNYTVLLRGADVKLPVRLLRFLFGDFTQVYLLAL
jgi:hypothetical protein